MHYADAFSSVFSAALNCGLRNMRLMLKHPRGWFSKSSATWWTTQIRPQLNHKTTLHGVAGASNLRNVLSRAGGFADGAGRQRGSGPAHLRPGRVAARAAADARRARVRPGGAPRCALRFSTNHTRRAQITRSTEVGSGKKPLSPMVVTCVRLLRRLVWLRSRVVQSCLSVMFVVGSATLFVLDGSIVGGMQSARRRLRRRRRSAWALPPFPACCSS